MAISNGDVLRAVVDIAMPDQVDAVNIWDWMRNDGEGGEVADADVLSALDTKITSIYTPLATYVVNTCTAVSATVYKLSWDTGRWIAERIIGVVSLGITGTDAGELLPHGVAALLHHGTAYARHQGRKFLTGFAEPACDDGFWTASCLTDLIAAAQEYTTSIVLPGSQILQPMLVGNDGATRGYDSYGASGTPAYQRRRKPGVGT